MLRHTVAVALTLLGAACAQPTPVAMSPEHSEAIRDSVTEFLGRLAAFLSSYPAGDSAVAAGRQFYADDVIYSGDVMPVDPIIIEGYTALTDASARPAWLREFEYRPERTVISPLAPGVAAVTEVYRDRFLDTTGVTTEFSGVVLLVLRNTSDGWRIVQLQAAHPAAADSVYGALLSRFEENGP